jgi:hypothetical protein
MRYNWKRDTPTMLSLLVCLVSTLPSCSFDGSRTVAPSSAVAALAITADSTTLSVGHVAQLTLSATDTAGNSIAASPSWTSLTPDVAAVSPTGMVTALASGEAVIEGRVSELAALGRIRVLGPANLASHSFDDGTLGPYTNPWRVDIDFPLDPTHSSRGRVARIRYQGGFGDQNRGMEFTRARRWGEPLYFKGDFYIPVDDISANDIIRKLIYWQPHNDYAKYTTNGGRASGRTVVQMTGRSLIVDAVYNPQPGFGKVSNDVRTVQLLATDMNGNQWYSLEVFQQMETAIGRADGILRVWLDGRLLFDRTNMTWSDPKWVGDLSNSVPFEESDIYFEHFMVGDQVNWADGDFNEYRYWDNVEFSTRPIGR